MPLPLEPAAHGGHQRNPPGVNKAPEADTVVTTAHRLVGLEFDEGEHCRFLFLGMGALDVAATMQKTNVWGF